MIPWLLKGIRDEMHRLKVSCSATWIPSAALIPQRVIGHRMLCHRGPVIDRLGKAKKSVMQDITTVCHSIGFTEKDSVTS